MKSSNHGQRASKAECDKRLSPLAAALRLKQIDRHAVNDVKSRLEARGAKIRAGSDDDVFAQFNTSLAIGLGTGLASFYAEVFHEIDKTVRDFEAKNNTEVHKGSIYFNMAALCLLQNDFDRAVYYFSAAGVENWKTHGHSSSALFTSNELFKRNVTNRLHNLFRQEYHADNGVINKMFGGPPHNAGIDTFFAALPPGLFASLIVTCFRYAVARSYEDNEGAKVLYHRLLTDFCHVFEVALKSHLHRTGDTLGVILDQHLLSTRPGNISAEIRSLRSRLLSGLKSPWRCDTVAELNSLLTTHNAISQIEVEADQSKALARLFSLVLAIRNQVAHGLDLQNELCQDIEKARRVLRWMLFALIFRTYL